MLALAFGKVMAASGWDCQRGPDGKDWVCVSDREKARNTQVEAEVRRPAPSAEKSTREEAEGTPHPKIVTPGPADRPGGEEGAALPKPVEEPSRPVTAEKSPWPAPAKGREAIPPGKSADVPQKAKTLPQQASEKPEIDSAAGQEAYPAGKSASRVQSKSGWNCRAGEERDWKCSLTGTDPRGEAHVVGGTGESAQNWSQSSDMTPEDEQRFSGILEHMPANPWTLGCGKRKFEWTPGSDYFFITEADRVLRDKSPLEIRADRAELVQGEMSSYEGTAELEKADQKLYGDLVTHNKFSGVLNAQGNVYYREKGLSFASDSAFMDLNRDQGVLRNAQFVLETLPARGTSRIAHIDSKTQSRYETVTYTTCQPGNQDWLLRATNATIDKGTGEGTAKNARLEFKGVPIFYTPYMSFPVDDRRKSGFLSPYAGYSKINGFDITLPYYFNLAPNYDFTFLPRYLEKRGELLRGDFRYLTETSTGRLFADLLPYDTTRENTRGQFAWRDFSRFSDHWSSRLDVHLVSDKRYLFELGTLLSINSSRNLRSWGSVNYNGGELFGGTYTAGLMMDYYQVLDSSIPDQNYPYRRMPQLTFTYARALGDSGFRMQTSGELAHFEQNVKATGERLNLRPRIYYPFQDPAGFITPSLSLQHTQYWLGNLGPGESSTFTRTAPIFSIDSGAFLDREFELFDKPMRQTLEPRLFYLFVPKVSQPYQYNYGLGPDGQVGYQGLNFDSNEYDFTFYQLFRENRFAGADRLSDANHLTPAATTRFISGDSGLERLRLSVGKIIYFTDPQVMLYPNGPQTTVKNNLVGELFANLSEHWSFRSTGQWNSEKDRIDRGQIALQYNNYANQLLNLSYRYRRDPYDGSSPPYVRDPSNPVTVNQSDISARLPIGAGWFGIGRWQYDLAAQVTVQTMLGVEKETCCWRFSIIGLRYINGALTYPVAANNVTSNNAVFFQIEFKGLGRLGDQIDRLLVQNFSGYRRPNELTETYP